jgi:hypothetical protein
MRLGVDSPETENGRYAIKAVRRVVSKFSVKFTDWDVAARRRAEPTTIA